MEIIITDRTIEIRDQNFIMSGFKTPFLINFNGIFPWFTIKQKYKNKKYKDKQFVLSGCSFENLSFLKNKATLKKKCKLCIDILFDRKKLLIIEKEEEKENV